MATKATITDDIPQWKKDLIARLRNQNKKSEERLWIEHHTPHALHTHPHPKTELVCPPSPDNNGFDKDHHHNHHQSTESSDSEDLHYGPGIVSRLKNKYLSLALRESNVRPTILRKATSLENLLDDDEGEEPEKSDGRIFRRRGGGKDGGSHLNHYRSGVRRQDMKRARSVEAISRVSHDEEMTMTMSVTAKVNNRQSLHEDILLNHHAIVKTDGSLDGARTPPSRPASFELKLEENTNNKFNGTRPHKTWWKSPLLDEKEKPPVDVVKQTKMIFEKRPEQRTKKPPQTGDVAAKVDSFNNIIVKAKVASKSKPPIKHVKTATNERQKNHAQHHRPVAKPVIISEDIAKPKSLDLKGPKKPKKEFGSLPSPIPDVSRVEIKSDGGDLRNTTKSHLSETPDLILTSSPLPKITSPTYRKVSSEHFIAEEKNSGYVANVEATNRYVSPIHSPKYHLNEERIDSPGIKVISPISQNNITKNSASSVFNFVHSHLDQKHLPAVVNKNVCDEKVPVSEPLNVEVNGYHANRVKRGLSAFEIERNHKNSIKSAVEDEKPTLDQPEAVDGEYRKEDEAAAFKKMVESSEKVEKEVSKDVDVVSAISDVTSETVKQIAESENRAKSPPVVPPRTVTESDRNRDQENRVVLKPAVQSPQQCGVDRPRDEDAVKIAFPKKSKPRVEESTTAVFNFTTRKEVPDYIANDTSRTPSRPVIPKPDEPGIKIISDSLHFSKEVLEVLEEDELIRNLEARPPSPCDVAFINDNVLIDGKSSLIQINSKRTKLKISFIDVAGVYEYPSENSLMLDESPLPSPMGGSASMGHTVPSLSGSTLATYTPKTIEGFELGVARTPPPPPSKPDVTDVSESLSDLVLEEVEKPILFSSGSTSDILF